MESTASEESFQDSSGEVAQTTPATTGNRKKLVLLALAGLVVIIGIVVLLYGLYSTSQRKTDQKQLAEPMPVTPEATNTIPLTTNIGLTFAVPKSWGGRFYKNSANDLRIELSDWRNPEIKEGTSIQPPANYIQAEIFVAMQTQPQKYLRVTNSEDVTLGDISFKKLIGKEIFSSKGRDFEQFSFNYKGKRYVLNVYSPNIKPYEKQIEDLLLSLGKTSSSSDSSGRNFFDLAVYAQEEMTTSPATPSVIPTVPVVSEKTPFPGIAFKELLPEAPPFQAQFTEQDGVWKENRAQGYFFTALADQRLTTIATEEAAYSFIKSDLYDENGNLVKGDLDTRIEFTVPATGKYFLIVQNFKNGIEKYNVRLQDRDQSDIVIKVKRYSDGAEFFFPPEVDVVTIPFADLAFLVNLNNVVNPSTINPLVYAQLGTKEQFKAKAFFPEDSKDNIVKTTSLQLENGAILVEPEGKQYPSGSQNVLSFSLGTNAGYTYRIFTE